VVSAAGIWLALLLSVIPSFRRLSAQASVQLSLGARYTSTMVHDSIVTAIDVRPTLAPSLAVTAATAIEHGWTADGTIDVSWSTLERHDQGGPTVGLGSLTTLAVVIGVRRALAAGLAGRLAVGGLKYFPGESTGIFRDGSGGVFPLGSATVSYVPPLAFAQRRSLGIEARYDVHAFVTPALRNRGFTSSRPVHRLALALRVTP